ncbi:MAG: hypothetical protein EXX96DRAFT_592467 [Benjaminiella poitrasii]|nr:MAG: hypothetical protein EXX96DRAFT_592467 [Benjaminiella poitrasii]
MNNNNYNATNNTPERYRYPTAIPPDALQRYGSAHLDQDIFGISVSRLSVIQQLVSKLIYQEGISVIILTIFGLSCCILYTFQKRFSFSGAFPFVCSLGAICLCSLGLRYIYDMDPLQILFPITVASLICIYIILELYFIMQNVTSDDFLLANVCFFIDALYPMHFIHHVCELTDDINNVFPDILYPGD